MDWEERVLPSIDNEVVKAVVIQYNAEPVVRLPHPCHPKQLPSHVSPAAVCPHKVQHPLHSCLRLSTKLLEVNQQQPAQARERGGGGQQAQHEVLLVNQP
jgi:hypothetical protein